jgi:uncharacterized SAM-binding protein YcdF (DUF218 family)
MRTALVQLGVPATRILTESTSLNTRDQAILVRPMLDRLEAQQVVLVTSQVHMRRSLGAFRAAGITAIPAVAEDRGPDLSWPLWILPSGSGLQTSAMAAHEGAGLVYYALRGWYR